MKIFIDSANLREVEEGLKRGFAQGITTNPLLLAKEPKSSFEGHIGKIIELVNKYQPGIHLSVEVFSREPAKIIEQAKQFVKQFAYPKMSIKIQMGWNELETIRELSQQGISVNCTACMTATQAIMAASAGAKYVSLFWGRIKDGGTDADLAAVRDQALAKKALDQKDFDPVFVVRTTREWLEKQGSAAEIIAGSIRSVNDIRDAGLAGAHIVTVPPKFFPDMAGHFKTDQVIDQFLTAFEKWLN